MKNDKIKVTKIVEELMNYFFHLGAVNMSINLEEKPESYEINFKAIAPNFSEKERNKLNKSLDIERSEATEEYYWCLTGECACDTELSLVGMMTDEANVICGDNSEVEISLKRYKK